MDRNRTIGQLAFVFAALLTPTAASAANCFAGTFAQFVACAATGAQFDTITLPADVVPDGTPVVVNADLSVLSTGGGLAGTGAFIKSGPGGLYLGVVGNTFTGPTTILAGALHLGSSGTVRGSIYVQGGTLGSIGSISIPEPGSIVEISGSGSVIAAASGTTMTVSQLSVQPGLSWTLGNAARNGTVQLVNPVVTPVSTNDLTLGGGIVRAMDVAAANLLSDHQSITLATTGALETTGYTFPIKSIAGSGSITNNGPGDLILQTGTFAGAINGSGRVMKALGGTVTLQGVNPYSGPTHVSQGILQIGPGGQLGSGPITLVAGSALVYNSFNQQVVNASIGGGGFLQVESGTLRLTGTNTLVGNTIVNAGTLVVDGSHVSSPITLNGSSSLFGSGTTGLITANSASVIQPGAFPGGTGVLSTGSLTMATFATAMSFQINGPAAGSGYDQIAVAGTVRPGNANLGVNGPYVPLAGESFILIANDGADAIIGSFQGVPEGSSFTLNGVPMIYSYLGGPGGNDFVVSVLTRTVTPSVAPNGTITPSTPMLVTDGNTATFTIAPAVGYSASVGGTCPPGAFTPPGSTTYTTNSIVSNCTVVPVFTLNTYSVTSSGGGPNGTVTPPSQPVSHGSTAVFTVTPATGYTASVGGTCPIGSLVGPTYTTGTITGACNVAVTFIPNTYTVTSSGGGANGTVTPPSQPANHGTNAAFTVTPAVGYTASFGGTCAAGSLVGATYTTGTITGPCNVAVTFTINSYTVTSSGGGANGTITPPSQPVNHGSTAPFTVTPAVGYTASFGGTCPAGSLVGTTYTTGTITAACNVAVTFTLNSYTVTSSGGGPNGTITPPSQSVGHGTTAAFTVTPSAGYTASFGGTCAAGSLVGTTYTTGTITAACNVAVTFTLNSYSVTSSGGGANGTITPPSQSVNHGTTAAFTVTPSTGYTASVGGTCPAGSLVGTTYTTGTITAACNVAATFTLDTYNVTSSGGGANGTITPPSQSVGHGTTAAFTVTPSAGYTASVGGSCPSGALVGPTYTTGTITAACNVAATFTQNTYGVTTAANPPAGGTVSCSPNPVAHGGTTTCTATANSTFQFAAWSGDCTGATCTLSNVTAAKSVTATFNLDLPRLVNVSTRAPVRTGNDVLIGGFVIGGSVSKTVVIRARGPSMAASGLANLLANPKIDLYSGQTVIASNDDFGTASNLAQLQASGFAPSDSAESAILATLAPGAYTAIVSGVGGTTGIGIVEIFAVDHPESPLLNIAARGPVLLGNDVMIAGFVVNGSGPQSFVVRARGRSLIALGLPNALVNPVLALVRSSDGAVIASNDDWQTAANAAALSATGLAPSDPQEAAILITLDPGAYTAIMSGAGGTTGVGIIEVFRN